MAVCCRDQHYQQDLQLVQAFTSSSYRILHPSVRLSLSLGHWCCCLCWFPSERHYCPDDSQDRSGYEASKAEEAENAEDEHEYTPCLPMIGFQSKQHCRQCDNNATDHAKDSERTDESRDEIARATSVATRRAKVGVVEMWEYD